MKSDADASAKVRRDHEEGRMDGAHVSNTAIYCCFYHYSLTRLSIDVECLASLALLAWLYTPPHLGSLSLIDTLLFC